MDILGLGATDLAGMPKMDVRKALLARLLRKRTQVGLEWISAELKMGVKSSVTRVKKLLSDRIKHEKKPQKLGKKLQMQQISSWSLSCTRAATDMARAIQVLVVMGRPLHKPSSAAR